MLPVAGRVLTALRAARRRVLTHRRPLAALLAAGAVATGVHAATAPPPPSERVLVAARDLPAGRTLTDADLTEARFAPGTVPASVSDDPTGRVLAAPLRSGEPVTDVRLVGPGLAAADDTVAAVPVRLPDAAMAGLLHPGDRIDLLASDPREGDSRVVAADVRVLAVPGGGATGPTGGAGVPAGALVVLGVPPGLVVGVADAGARSFLSFAFAR